MTDNTTGGIKKSIGTDRREIGAEAVWSLSTAKPGNGKVSTILNIIHLLFTSYPSFSSMTIHNPIYLPTSTGVEQIRDDNLDTYWQSDGAQPHMINIQFHKKMTILEVALYLDYTLDESYTPKKVR